MNIIRRKPIHNSLSMNQKSIVAIGLMSGTSLDGLDVALCKFWKTDKTWHFAILEAITYSYTDLWRNKLRRAHQLSGFELVLLHNEFGKFCGEKTLQFMRTFSTPKPDLIAAHGHTIFHQPDKKLTLQIGNAAEIAASTGIATIADFRTLDVALGGQGAPLVPIGDELLFADYGSCINLGGFANVSYRTNNERIAFDICPVNIVLNGLCSTIGKKYDDGGAIGRTGQTDKQLLNQLNGIEYYKKISPKSLGREWLENIFVPLLKKSEISVVDKLSTVYEHIAVQIGNCISKSNEKILLTGGGAKNCFLVKKIQSKKLSNVVVPDEKIIDFKEAMIFAFMGVLRSYNAINTLASVTGASKNSSGGAIFKPAF